MPKAYLYNQEHYFTEEVNCPIDPLESELQGHDIYIQPADSTFLKPLEAKEGFKIKFDIENDEWFYEEEKKEEPAPYVPTELDNLQAELWKVKAELQELDYIGVKIATGRATIEEYAEEITHMNELADKINELEEQIKILQNEIDITAQA